MSANQRTVMMTIQQRTDRSRYLPVKTVCNEKENTCPRIRTQMRLL